MHLHAILAFALLFWRAEVSAGVQLVPDGDVVWTMLIVWCQPVAIAIAGWLASRRIRRRLRDSSCNNHSISAQRTYHRVLLVLRATNVGGFAVSMLLTPWSNWFALSQFHPAFQILGDLIVLAPFVAGQLMTWITAYPVEKQLRCEELADDPADGSFSWRLSTYLDFNLRHHLLVVAVPMTLILFAGNLTRGYEAQLQQWLGSVWAPDVLLGASALGVFLVSPVLLTRIWHTHPLEAGPVRDRLEAICGRMGLRFRDILVWRSDGMMINAAVMGIVSPVRFVLLSDGLLSTMNPNQIEAVFGHEAGHIRHRHIQHFLLFAYVGWLLATGGMELLAYLSIEPGAWWSLSGETVQLLGVGGTLLFWAGGFGWLSRHFERQADLFGASCVQATSDGCDMPCSVHLDRQSERVEGGGVCATGATIFASALERVAALNGVSQDDWSWRHPSIGSRVRFLASLAGCPRRADQFGRAIMRIKRTMIVLALIGSAISVYYWFTVETPMVFRL